MAWACGARFRVLCTHARYQTRPLSQLGFIRTESNASQPVMNMWSFHKSGVFDKGPRSDIKWILKSGNTLNLWLDEVSFNFSYFIASSRLTFV